MKRHESLRPLSRDHHHGLAEARALRWALSGRAGTPLEARKNILSAWRRWLAPHFEDEERWIVPLIPDAADAQRLAAEHLAIRRIIESIARSDEGAAVERELLGELAMLLDDHIRWEERHLFPILERAASATALSALAANLARRPTDRFGHDSLSAMDPR